MNLSPYAKTVVSAVGTLVAVAINIALGNGADAATLGTAIIGLLTTLGVFQVTNAPKPEQGDAVTPSDHEVVEVPASVANIVALAAKDRKPKPRPRPTPKAIKPRKKVTRPTDKKGE